MKKGDIRKQEILQTAEQLFCRKGYEKTSVQDILDQLKSSKGSFYHHFASKESLLETICARRAEQNAASAFSASELNLNAKDRLNHVLMRMIPLSDERLSFVMMLLPVFDLAEGKSIRISYCESLRKAFHDAVREAIVLGNRSGEMACGDPDIFADIVISLVNLLWISVCDLIIENERKGEETDPGELLHITDQYRSAVERTVSVAFGTLILIDIRTMKRLADQIHMHWDSKQSYE